MLRPLTKRHRSCFFRGVGRPARNFFTRMQVSPDLVENQPTAPPMEKTTSCGKTPNAHRQAGHDIADRLCEPLTKGKAG